MGRREFLQMSSLVAATPSIFAQDASPVAVQKIHSCDMRVTDVTRSVKFYQDFFGAPVQARRGEQVFLRVGDGPRFFSLSPTLPGQEPGFSHIGLSVAGFDAEQIQAQLERFGIAREWLRRAVRAGCRWHPHHGLSNGVLYLSCSLQIVKV